MIFDERNLQIVVFATACTNAGQSYLFIFLCCSATSLIHIDVSDNDYWYKPTKLELHFAIYL